MVQHASPIPIPTSAPLSTPPPSSPAQARAILEELNNTDVNELRQWFESKKAALEAEERRQEREDAMEEQALTPVSETFWIGIIDLDSPVGEGSGLTEVRDEVPLLSGHCLNNH